MSPAVRQRFDRDDTENGMCGECGLPATTRPLVWDCSAQFSEHSAHKRSKTAPENTDWRPSTTGYTRARPNRSTCLPSGRSWQGSSSQSKAQAGYHDYEDSGKAAATMRLDAAGNPINGVKESACVHRH
ncbi:hypothetical protein IscW_ISCW005450 [Ixodes scapularis]|uniref:Uncharacterized protein n=1 Tax=Ixodes scapularis TaxID=6945 RepID=B7PRA3_IXOSC|nr:hypothetical protein IscW_ISCW005450 [Ixodes scapularis]|eukprot:XP_002436295.1 hypothetical protein IscW_ISCW005450 [Ixodes scapularis]